MGCTENSTGNSSFEKSENFRVGTFSSRSNGLCLKNDWLSSVFLATNSLFLNKPTALIPWEWSIWSLIFYTTQYYKRGPRVCFELFELCTERRRRNKPKGRDRAIRISSTRMYAKQQNKLRSLHQSEQVKWERRRRIRWVCK